MIENVGNSYTHASSGNCTACAAPELLDSRSGSTRPTTKSDMYSFGCLCIEVRNHPCQCENTYSAEGSNHQLYLGGPLYGSLREFQILQEVLKGKRPKRPRVAGQELDNELWSFVKSCWKQQPSKRPTAMDASQLLCRITQD